MKLKKYLVGLLLICGIGAALVYASMDDPESRVVFSHTQSHDRQGTQGTAAHSGGSDHFGCHNHGAVTYHCH